MQPLGPISQYPDTPHRRVNGEEEPRLADQEVRNLRQDLRDMWADIANLAEDTTHRVDEYRVQTLSVDANTGVTLQPEYEVGEIITSVIVTGPVNSAQSVTSEGQTGATPAQNATVASISAALLQSIGPVGTAFDVQWETSLVTAAAAGDANNFYLSSPLNTLRQQGINPGAIGGPYVQQGLQRFVPGAAGINIQVGQAGAGTAGAIYAGSLTATVSSLVDAPFTLKLGKRVWNLLLPPTGILVIAPVQFSLGRNDDRILTSPVPGDWALELCGYANFTESYRTLE